MKRFFYSPAFLLVLAMVLLFGLTAKSQGESYFDFGTEFPMGADETIDNSGNALEVGVKFQTDVTGIVRGVHFYKNASNTGTHIANLWTDAGANLATANDGGALGTGWRYIEFAAPVSISPSTTYIVSVFMPTGFYSATINYFNGVPPTIRNNILLLSDAAAQPPGNGVFIQNATSAFPNGSFNAANYWIDLQFQQTFPLPVTLTDFRATTSNSDVLLSWKTETETNNKGFEIQRSNNSSDWYPVKFVNSTGDGSFTRTYSYTDKGLAPGLYYYRLKQLDFDGKSTFSPIATATIAGKGKTLLFQNYPNPFSGTSTIRFDLPTDQMIKLSIIDMTGREVRVLANKLGQAGSHQVTIDAAALQRQIYLVRLQTESGVLTKTILVE
ncbi:MAG TPA: DUF4082 domain-containing protein [Chitinophagaceae bacterium]|nr:DUF4082 domain-containing protein [Chitinophagaceae bacterium]